MLETGRKLHFPPKPISIDPGGELGGQNLDHDFPLELDLLSDEDATHATAAELALKVVDVAERGLQPLAEIGQRDGPLRRR